MAVMDTVWMLLFDHGCAVFLWLMLAVVPEDRAWEGRGQALLLYQEVTGSCSGLRRHRNLPGAQDKAGFAAVEKASWKWGCADRGRAVCKNPSFFWLWTFLSFTSFVMKRNVSNAGKPTQLGVEARCQHVYLGQVVLNPPSSSEAGITGDELFQTKEQLGAQRSAGCCLKWERATWSWAQNAKWQKLPRD